MKRRRMAPAVRAFDARRALRMTGALWEAAKDHDTPAIWRTAEVAAQWLREAGADSVELLRVPGDGRTHIGGWSMPVAWELSAARLEVAGAPELPLADDGASRLAAALWSPPTPGGAWVEGAVVVVTALDAPPPPEALRDRFVVVRGAVPTFAFTTAAAHAGARALIATRALAIPDAVPFLNYSVPPWADVPALPVFALSPRQASRLDALIEANPALRLRARVVSRRYADAYPLVSATVGAGPPTVYVCAHLDEPGALDNASGTAVAIEAVRALAATGAGGGRALQVLFSTEVRGLQWWMNAHARGRGERFVCGLNVDIVGVDPRGDAFPVQLLRGFRHRAHFAPWLLARAVDAADAVADVRPPRTWRDGYVSDAQPGLRTGGHVAIEQRTDETYHSSADTPDRLHLPTLHWCGLAATAYLDAARQLDNTALRRLAACPPPLPGAPEADAAVAAARAATAAQALRTAWTPPQIHVPLNTPAEYYAAGVNPRSGLWPTVAAERRFDALLARCAAPRCDERDFPAHADDLVPVARFAGFLSFECGLAAATRARLAAIGLGPSWGTVGWAWQLVDALRGRRTLTQTLRSLAAVGVAVDPAKARELVLALAESELVALRPLLTRATIAQALRAAGVRAGGTLVLHASLTRFGHVCGGPEAFVGACRDALGPAGTLVMPTHSVSILGTPPYDPAKSPALTGSVAEWFRKQPGVCRSAHPTHSLAAIGPASAAILDAHRPDQAPFARDGAWGRLYAHDAQVLLLCALRSATALHLAETWLALPQRGLVAHARRRGDGREIFMLPNAPWHVHHFETHLAPPLLESGRLTAHALGDSTFWLGDVRSMADIGLRFLADTPEILIAQNGRCDCTYCAALRTGLAARAAR